jgi:hypothetical protein
MQFKEKVRGKNPKEITKLYRPYHAFAGATTWQFPRTPKPPNVG